MAILSLGNGYDSLLEIPNNIYPFGFFFLLAGIILVVFYKLWLNASFFVVALYIHIFFFISPRFVSEVKPSENGKFIRIFHANVLNYYDSKSKLEHEITKGSYDLISILECTPKLFDYLNKYKGRNFRLLAEVRTDSFGICLLYNKGEFVVERF